MTTIITIHRGEILEIQRTITKTIDIDKLKLQGDLYGLHAISGQPVVQITCEIRNSHQSQHCKNYLRRKHGLAWLGKWIVIPYNKVLAFDCPNEGGLTLVFDTEAKISTAYDSKGNGANLEILQGNSALRLYDPLVRDLHNLLNTDNLVDLPSIKRDESKLNKVEEDIHKYSSKQTSDDIHQKQKQQRPDTKEINFISDNMSLNSAFFENKSENDNENESLQTINNENPRNSKSFRNTYAQKHHQSFTNYPNQNMTESGTNALRDKPRLISGHLSYINDKGDACNNTSHHQWYNHNKKLLADLIEFVGSVSDSSPELKRDSKTEDMSILFHFDKHYWIIELPATFPLGETKVLKLHLSEHKTRATVVQRFCYKAGYKDSVDFDNVRQKIFHAITGNNVNYQYETYV